MKIEKYYESLLKSAISSMKKGEPITFVGMYDCGKNYLFTLLFDTLDKKPINIFPVFIDLQSGTMPHIIETIGISLSLVTKLSAPPKNKADVISIVHRMSKKRRICFIINIGYGVAVDPEFFQLLSQLRNLLGWEFTTVFFANTGFLFQTSIPGPLFDKVLKKNVHPVVPLDEADSQLVLSMYERRYRKRLSAKVAQLVIAQSGGNPGFLKGLYLQAKEDRAWKLQNIFDERLYFRIQRLVEELPMSHQQALRLRSHKESQTDISMRSFLARYGYTKLDGALFSPLVNFYLTAPTPSQAPSSGEELDDLLRVKLTSAERRVYARLAQNAGKLVSRDVLAQALWAEAWADKYSDWAIDQVMHGLRDKLIALGTAGSIQTKKGEGYVFLLTPK
ncbi:helix-turn-helix domain-containing protein [Candidatus Gottesmanbacteria bacterium]|nr:helix-turn-helix domain-containing protein [Candidatus Gottesmanbacteria bacterium]